MIFMWVKGAKGLWVGALLGGLSGLGVYKWMIDGTLLFPGDTILFGAINCAVFGFLHGEVFFDWLMENWYRVLG